MQRDIPYTCTYLHTCKVEANGELSKQIGYVGKLIWQTHTHTKIKINSLSFQKDALFQGFH
jgi:hypothetical protein